MYHRKYLSLCPDYHEHMSDSAKSCYCSSCISHIFLNTVEEDDILFCELNAINIDEHTTCIGSLAERLFNLFQLNDKDYYTPLSEIDPDDVNLYSNIDSHLGLNCSYYLENSFYDLMNAQTNCLSTDNVFSLCHIIYVASGKIFLHLNPPWII